MKWLFLAFILALAVAGNGALLSVVTPFRVLGALAFTAFAISLAALWWFGYFTDGSRRTRGLILSHGLLMLSAGFAVCVLGAMVSLTGGCEVLNPRGAGIAGDQTGSNGPGSN